MTPKLTDDAVSMLPLESGRAELLEEIMSTVAPRPHPGRAAPPSPAAVAAAGSSRSPLRPSSRASSPAPCWAAGLLPGRGQPRWPRSLGAGRAGEPGCARRPRLGGHQHRERRRRLRRGELREGRPGQFDDHLVPGRLLRVVRRRPRAHRRAAAPRVSRSRCSAPAGQLWAYSSDDHTVIREVEDGFWIEFRGSGMDEAGYLALLDRLTMQRPDGFEASLPEDFVTDDERRAAIDSDPRRHRPRRPAPRARRHRRCAVTLRPVRPLPARRRGRPAPTPAPGSRPTRTPSPTSRPAQAARSGRGCSAPRATGRCSHEMNERGDYPEVIWDYSDTVAVRPGSGGLPGGSRLLGLNG